MTRRTVNLQAKKATTKPDSTPNYFDRYESRIFWRFKALEMAVFAAPVAILYAWWVL